MPDLEKELHSILEDFAQSRANDIELHQSSEHSYWNATARIERAFKAAGYTVK